MTYEDFFAPWEIQTFRRVKKGQMQLAAVARKVASDLVSGQILPSGKEFVRTPRGVFRLSMSHASDNSTERFAHDRLGARLIVMSDDESLGEFFSLHGLDAPLAIALHRAETRRSLTKPLT